MAGTLVAGRVSAGRTGRVRFELATEADDADIRRLLRENPTRGQIALSLEREPDYFAEEIVPGTERQTIVAREHGHVVCAGSCTLRERFVNGEPRRVGYLGGLRLDASAAGRFDILRRGYEFFRELQADAPADFYFTSIAADNARARRWLERGLPGMPRYEFIGEFVTVLPPASRSSRREEAPFKSEIRNPKSEIDHPDRSGLTSAPTGELVATLNQHNRRHQLAPCWSAAELAVLPRLGLREEDFLVVREGDGFAACAALWDQRCFKQTVIRGYAPLLSAVRPFANAFARVTGRSGLPAAGTTLAHAFVSHLAVAPGRPELLVRLLHSLAANAAARNLEFLTLGFAANDPRLATVRRHFSGREYRSRIYVVRWPEVGGAAHDLDNRCLSPEVALL